jgi:V/A-type H+-transporting ATPase subunit I
VFRPAPMVQVSALVLKRDERAVLYGLGRAGAVHLSRTEAGPQTAPLDPPDRSPDLAHCDDLLRRLENVYQALDIADRQPGDKTVTMTLDQVDQRLLAIEQQVEEVARRTAQLERQWGQATALLDQISGYQDLELPLEQLGSSAFLHFAVGSLPDENLAELHSAAGGNVVLLPLDKREERRPVVAITSRKGRFAMETTLKQAGFRHEPPPVKEGGDIGAVTEESRAQQTRLAAELERVRGEQELLTQRTAPSLAALERAVREERAILEAQQHFPRTDSAVLITGWAPADHADAVEGQLRRVSGGRCAIRKKKPDDIPLDQIPILLRQPRLLRPFTMLVTGYGLPGYRDLEPTLLVAITYLLMFGIMFGDVGHGALLAIGGSAALLVSRAEKIRDYGLIVLMAGLSSLFFGAVYGSYFGIPALHGYALWHDPLHEPVRLMIATVGVGIAMISMGVILNIVNHFRRGEFLNGVLDKFGLAGIIFYWGSLIFIVKYTTLCALGLAGAVLLLVVALPLLALTLKEPIQYALSRRAGHAPHSENIFMAFIESMIEAFEAVLAYLANTISFVRLAAYAMSHAAILMATFAMADAVAETPAVGSVLYVAIVIGGNAVALILEGIIVAVQVLRLEYYEFFGKFFSGTGLPFRPFQFALRR